MQQIKDLFKGFSISRVFIPLMITFGLCFIYNLIYLITVFSTMNFVTAYFVQIILALVSSIGLYFICTRLWPRRPKTFAVKKIIMVLGIEAFYILLVQGLLFPLYVRTMDITAVRIILQLLAAAGIIFMVPLQLLAYYGVYAGHDMPGTCWQFVKKVFAKAYKPLLNWFCTLIILVAVFDTLWTGVYSMVNGFDPVNLLVTLLFAGNPLMSWMQLLFVGMLQGMPLAQMWVPVFGCFFLGFCYTIFELNYAVVIGRECRKYGSEAA